MKKTILGIISLFLMATSALGNKTSEKTNEDSARIADSISQEEVVAEQASIGQNSNVRRDFKTSDLAFNDLHGDVKNYEFNDVVFSYNEDGSIVPSWNAEDIRLMKLNEQNSLPQDKITRDREGRIIKVWEFVSYDGEYGEFFDKDYIWEGERAIGKYESKNYREYNDNGLIICYFEDENYDIQPLRIVFTDYVLDGVGNWVERTANIFTYEPDEMNTFDFPVDKSSVKQTRTITYYKSNGSSRTKLENSLRQKELLKMEQHRYSNAEEKYTYDDIY